MAAQQTKKPNLFQRLGSFFAKSWSELKKVSWPNFKTVIKNTIIVFLVVLFFSVVILAADLGFTALLDLFAKIK